MHLRWAFLTAMALSAFSLAGAPDFQKGARKAGEKIKEQLKEPVIRKHPKFAGKIIEPISKVDFTKTKKVKVFPYVVGTFPEGPPSTVSGVPVGGLCKKSNLVFLAQLVNNAYPKLVTVEVSDPANPQAGVQTPVSENPHPYQGCEIYEDKVIVPTWGGMKVFRQTDLSLAGFYDFTSMPSAGATPFNNVAYLYVWPGVHLVDLSNLDGSMPSPPELNLLATIPEWGGSNFTATRADRLENFLFITGKPGVTRLNVENETDPSNATPFSIPNVGHDIAHTGDFVFVTGRGDSLGTNTNYKGFTIVKVFGDDQGPKLFYPFYELGTPNSIFDNPNGIDIDGDFVYIAAGTSGLLIYHIDPLQSAQTPAPVFAGRCEMNCPAKDVIVDGDYAYVSCGNGGLRICGGIR